MALDILTWVMLVRALRDELAKWKVSRPTGLSKDDLDAALLALMTAAEETRTYVEVLQKGKPPKEEKEVELAKLWRFASVPMRRVDPDLARRFELKAEYWRNPDEWTTGQIREAKIGFDHVYKESRAILMYE